MTVVRIRPGVATGRLRAPPSKSYTHRAIVAGHLAQRAYRIDRPLDADDTRATARSVALLNTAVRRHRNHWDLRPRARTPRPGPVEIDCEESGTTLRFASAIAAKEDRPVTFVGRGRLPSRPMQRLWGALTELGASCRFRSGTAGLPVTIQGPVHGGTISLDVSESSQFASALLLVLPTLPEDSTLTLLGRLVSRPYMEATLAVLSYHRVRVERNGRRFHIPGNQEYRGSRFPVPGDASSSAYFWVAAALTGGHVRIDGLPSRWPQADLVVLDLLESAGAEVHRTPSGATVRPGALRPFRIDLTDAPDLYPLAGVVAAAIPGRSEIRGASHVVAKESDRRAGTRRLARALGARVTTSTQGLVVEGTRRLKPFSLRGELDHRMVMSAAVGALASSGPCTIEDGNAVGKSFPEFWDALRRVAEGVVAP
ncbi:MAG: 3-phosphoshikimate 1-carboxyvinyltransferase, partial [Thermoplasmata archaeon]|jgi:3-phosphoshikimate 1-carboxyvinyltransferase